MPDDTTPHGGEAMHPLPDRAKIPEPKPGAQEREYEAERPPRDELPLRERPPLPDHPEQMAADIEDEEADPVVESGPGVAEETGKPSVTRQPGG
jgi:hypothetical protein